MLQGTSPCSRRSRSPSSSSPSPPVTLLPRVTVLPRDPVTLLPRGPVTRHSNPPRATHRRPVDPPRPVRRTAPCARSPPRGRLVVRQTGPARGPLTPLFLHAFALPCTGPGHGVWVHRGAGAHPLHVPLLGRHLHPLITGRVPCSTPRAKQERWPLLDRPGMLQRCWPRHGHRVPTRPLCHAPPVVWWARATTPRLGRSSCQPQPGASVAVPLLSCARWMGPSGCTCRAVQCTGWGPRS